MANILENRIIIILISMIWGFGLALLLRETCYNKCVVIKVSPFFNNSNNNIIHN